MDDPCESTRHNRRVPEVVATAAVIVVDIEAVAVAGKILFFFLFDTNNYI